MNSYDDDVYVNATSSCDICLITFVFSPLVLVIVFIWAMAGGR